MSTIGRRAFEVIFYERCNTDANWLTATIETKKNLDSNYYEKVDWFGQYFERHGIDMIDAHVFSILHCWSCMGDITFAQIYVGKSPRGDSQEEENNNLLSNLPKGFSAKFVGGYGEGDGSFQWDYPVSLDVIDIEGKRHLVTLEPDKCVLEVGYTRFNTTYEHLTMQKTLARWPYESEYIILMNLSDKKFRETQPDYSEQ